MGKRTTFLGLSILSVVFGITHFGIGIWATVDPQAFSSAFDTNDALFHHMTRFAIGVGILAIVLGIIGFLGGYKNNDGILKVFTWMLLAVILSEFALMVFAFVFLANVEDFIAQQAMISINVKYGQQFTATAGWDTLQRKFECCGFYNGSDYAGSLFDAANINRQPWPASCCTINRCGQYVKFVSCLNDDPVVSAHTNAAVGCLTAIIDWLSDYTIPIGCFGIFCMTVQIILFQLARDL